MENENQEQLNQLRGKTFNKDLRSLIDDITEKKVKGVKRRTKTLKLDFETAGRLSEKLLSIRNIKPAIKKQNKPTRKRKPVIIESFDEPIFNQIEKYFQANEISVSNCIYSLFEIISSNKPLVEQSGEIQKLIDIYETSSPKEESDDILSKIITFFWEDVIDYSEHLEKFSRVCYYIGKLLGAKATSCLAYSVKNTCFRPIFYRGFDKMTIANLAFIPQENTVKKLIEDQLPHEFALFSFRDDLYMRKKFSAEFWNEQDKLLFIPLVANYKDIKPKNLLIILFVIPFEQPGPGILDIQYKRKIQTLFNIFSPIVEMVQENIREYEETDISPSHIVEEVYAILNDRKSYHGIDLENEGIGFSVINFQLKTVNHMEHEISFQYLFAKLQNYLSINSKLLRYSYDKGYIVLMGYDIRNSSEIIQTMMEHDAEINWQEKSFPQMGKNLFNYQ